MYLATSRKSHKGTVYEYLQLCESVRTGRTTRRRVLLNLGRKDLVNPATVDRIIDTLKPLASEAVQLELTERGATLESSRSAGAVLALRHLWEELELPKILVGPDFLESAVFRLVTSRLLDPQSKLATVDWQLHDVAWPDAGHHDYRHFLQAMDLLYEQKAAVEDALFAQVRDLFSVPLQLVWYDLTTSYFEGDGVCPLAEFGYSRDHRTDRRQIALGLTITQEGFPIAHEVWPGNRADVTTVAATAQALQQRFGIREVVVVADRGMLSDANIKTLEQSGYRYVMALRTHQHRAVGPALTAALAAGLDRPREQAAPWSVMEVAPEADQRRVVVYSAFKALHDREVRGRRIRRTMEGLLKLQAAVAAGRLQGERSVTTRAERILRDGKAVRFIRWELRGDHFTFGLDLAYLRAQRRRDGIFVLVTNDPSLSTDEVVQAYRQLYRVERAFRVLKSLTKLRPMYHHASRRVRAHVFLCVMAYLLAAIIEQRLQRAGLDLSAADALRILGRIHAVEFRTPQFRATQLTATTPEASAILASLGLRELPTYLAFEHF